MQKRLLTALTVAALMAPNPMGSTSASAGEFIQSLTGNWRGSGLVKPGPQSDQESIRCKLRSNNGRIKTRLVMNGNCAVAGLIFRLNGWIEQNGSGNRFSASMFQSLANISTQAFSGRRSGNRLNFNFTAIHKKSKQPIKTSIQVVRKSSNRFDVHVSRTDPSIKGRFKVGTISFSKR